MGKIALAPLIAGAGAAAGAAGTLGTIATAVSIGTSLFAGLQQFQAGRQESQDLKDQAEFERLQSVQEEANRQTRLSQILSTQMAQAAGRGITVDSGSNIAVTEFSIEEAERESRLAKLDSEFRQEQILERSRQARRSGQGALFSALGGAGGKAYSFSQDVLDRQQTNG